MEAMILDKIVEIAEIHSHMAVFAGYLDVLCSVFDTFIVKTLNFVCFGCILQSVYSLLILTNLLTDASYHYILAAPR